MLGNWVARAPSLEGKGALFDVLKMPEQVFDYELGTLYSFSGGDKPPGTFGEALKLYMENTHISVEELAFESGISERSISEMRNRNGYRPKLSSLVKICVAMHLSPSYSYHLLELAGYRLTDSKVDVTYRLLLDKAQEITVEECNMFMEKAKVNP